MDEEQQMQQAVEQDRAPVFTMPAIFPARYVSRIGVETVVLGRANDKRIVGFFRFSDGEISSADWDTQGRFDKHHDKDTANDIFDAEFAPMLNIATAEFEI